MEESTAALAYSLHGTQLTYNDGSIHGKQHQ